MAEHRYVHGYSVEDSARLVEQAEVLEDILHEEVEFPAGTRILEAGCGVGAQTVILARRFPEAEIVSVDISEEYLEQAEERVQSSGCTNVTFRRVNLVTCDLPPGSADHIYVSFVLEHPRSPERRLQTSTVPLGRAGRSPSSKETTARPSTLPKTPRPGMWWTA